jgi:DNA-binding NarL/FixJ family response regulator
MSAPVRVLIADDQALLRATFRLLIDREPDLEAVGEAGTGDRAVELARSTAPDVVLMDIRMPGMDGIEATRRLCDPAAPSGSRVIILTMFDLDSYVYAALRAGASGFLLKDTPPADLLTAIRVVAAGEALLAPSVTRRLIAEFARAAEPGPATGPLERITGREREILVLICRGLSNSQIRDRLRITLPTVKSHVSSLLTKLNARDRTQLVIIAYEAGLVSARGDFHGRERPDQRAIQPPSTTRTWPLT